MFRDQPRGLWILSVANMGERFGYYTMLAVFSLFLQERFGWSVARAGFVYSLFLTAIYFLPLFGGLLADRFGYARMVTVGLWTQFVGYALLAVPLGAGLSAVVALSAALLLVSVGTGLLKGNLQVLVGDLYSETRFAARRDSGFMLFYMTINIGAFFAPAAAVALMNLGLARGLALADAYRLAYGLAAVSAMGSVLAYQFYGRRLQRTSAANGGSSTVAEAGNLSPAETRARIVCLMLVFVVVVFFWMAFHQNGSTLTFFARDFVAEKATGFAALSLDVGNLLAMVIAVYAGLGCFQARTAYGRSLGSGLFALAVGFLVWRWMGQGEVRVSAPLFQQLNPCFVVALTPISIAIFSGLARHGREPSAPVKIAVGMALAAVAYVLLAVGSVGLPCPQAAHPVHVADVSPNLLTGTYLILTLAELLLSPIGISFVSRVSPPKSRGLMMGGWFVATAVGNLLVAVPTALWGRPLVQVWGAMAGICLLASLMMCSVLGRLRRFFG